MDAVVSNVYPLSPRPIEEIDVQDLRATFEAILVFPFRLTQLFLLAMKARCRGTFVFVTSARELRPERGFAVPISIRSGATSLAKALAKEAAPFGIQVNVVAPITLRASSTMRVPGSSKIRPAGRRSPASFPPVGSASPRRSKH